MLIEEKLISEQEVILFFSEQLPISGTFYHDKKNPSTLQILQNIGEAQAEELLLTRDFLYLKSTSPQTFDDAKMIALAELDDFTSETSSQQNAPQDATEQKARIILKTIVAPFLQKDGGNVELINISNGIAYVKFTGKCNGCPYAQKTLKERVEKNLVHYLPEIRETVLA